MNTKQQYLLIIIFILITSATRAQLIYQPYSFQFYQKLNNDIYSPKSSLNTSLKPFVLTDTSELKKAYDSLMNAGIDSNNKTWAYRKLFKEHLVEIKDKEYTFYFDYLPDLQVGKDIAGKKSTWLNTRGFQAGGTIGGNFFFYTSGFENQGVFPDYLMKYIYSIDQVPGQGRDYNFGTADWSYTTSVIGYAPNKTVFMEMGIDKTFIGDGYRSLLLSDFASNYPLFRINVRLGNKVQYMAMWALMQDQNAPTFGDVSGHIPYRRKWAAFHYIDWAITNRASLSFFNAIITAEADDNGYKHAFDANFVNPIFFARLLSPKEQIPDNMLAGFNAKYKIFDKTTLYGQLVFDKSLSAYQIGFRGSDLFKVRRFNYLLEYNTAKPYTYSSQYPLTNYAELDQPLADPLGANFKELVGILNYTASKFDFQTQINYARYGLNLGNVDYGQNILLPAIVEVGNTTGQGLNTSLKYAEGKVAYLINAKYNLRLELGGLLREESNFQSNNRTALVTFGLRSTFRNIYTDF